MSINLRLRATITTGVLVAASLFVAVPTAQADSPCTITNFSPRSVVVGLTPVTARFGVSTSGCDLEGWDLSIGPWDYYVYDSAPQETFAPYDNSDAGAKHVIAEVHNSDYDATERTFASAFSLKRRTTWQSGTFNASPEPVRKGRNITIKGRLLVANWTHEKYTPPASRTVSIQFRTSTGSYATVKRATTRSDGWLVTTVTAQRTGYWRVVYSGDSVTGSAVATGDNVKVIS